MVAPRSLPYLSVAKGLRTVRIEAEGALGRFPENCGRTEAHGHPRHRSATLLQLHGQVQPEPVGDPHQGVDRDVPGASLDLGEIRGVHADALRKLHLGHFLGFAHLANVQPYDGENGLRVLVELVGHARDVTLCKAFVKWSYRTMAGRTKDEEVVSRALDRLLDRDPGFQRVNKRILLLQRKIKRVVSDETWRVYLALEELVNLRNSELLDAAVRLGLRRRRK